MSDLVFKQFRGVSVSWENIPEIKGQTVSIQASHSDNFKEVKSVPNKGHVNLAFGGPNAPDVTSNIRIEGSRGGRVQGTVEVK